MEFMALASPRFDMARFGAEAPRFSPRQADLLWIVGTISQRQAPVLRRIYEQMADPKWVLAFGTCASCGGFYDNYTTLAGVDKVIPCDIYVPGCPPRPEQLMEGIIRLHEAVQAGIPPAYELRSVAS
jgi:NADH-quinone oxidoreductase subunit B